MNNWGNWNLNNATVGGPSSSFDVVSNDLCIMDIDWTIGGTQLSRSSKATLLC